MNILSRITDFIQEMEQSYIQPCKIEDLELCKAFIFMDLILYDFRLFLNKIYF